MAFNKEIVENIACLNDKGNGWQKRLMLIRWNDGPMKYDIRDWSNDLEKCSKGITFTREEMENLYLELQKIFG